MDPKPVSANPLIASMEDLLRRTLGEQIEPDLILAPNLWPTLCDPHQLENAVLNLAINARNAGQAEPVAGDGKTVLVIEDEPVVRSLIVEVVADLGFAALEATEGNGGLEILQSRQRIDLLISDIGLPGLNGRQLAEAARLIRPGLKVIFMTGYADLAASAQGFLKPGMALITKPFAMAELATKIRATVEDL